MTIDYLFAENVFPDGYNGNKSDVKEVDIWVDIDGKTTVIRVPRALLINDITL